MSQIVSKVDVAVIGGGPAGVAAALRLADSAVSVAVLERADALEARASRIGKVGETVPPQIRPVLEALGAWESFLVAEHLPGWGTSSCWGSSEIGYNDFLLQPAGPGWHLDRVRFERDLRRVAVSRGVSLLHGMHVRSSDERLDGWRLTVGTEDGDRSVDARIVVDASGRQSAFARLQGATRLSFDSLVGAYRFFRRCPDSASEMGLTLIEAAEAGWWYSAALPRGRMVACFMTDAGLLRSLRLGEEAPWRKQVELSRHTAYQLKGLLPLGPVQVKLASSTILDPLAGRNWIAAGDAAATFDPLSSRGILKALQSGIRAGDAARSALAGDETALARHAGQERAEMKRYLEVRGSYYSAEQRWPGAPFWRRRQGIRPNEASHQRVTPPSAG